MKLQFLWLLLLLVNCGHRQVTAGRGNPDAGFQTQPVDRLLPGELAQSKLLVFGFPIPQGMTVARRYADSVHMVGAVSPSALTTYVKAHAATGPGELVGNRKVFSKVRIRAGSTTSKLTVRAPFSV